MPANKGAVDRTARSAKSDRVALPNGVRIPIPQEGRDNAEAAASSLLARLRSLRDTYGDDPADLSLPRLEAYGASKLDLSLIREYVDRRSELTHWQKCQWEFNALAWHVQSKEIGDFIRAHFPNATDGEVRWIEDRVARERDGYEDGRVLRWSFSLAQLVRGGLGLVRALRIARWVRGAFFVALTILVNLALVFLALYAYSAATSDFQILVLSLLLVIFAGVAALYRETAAVRLKSVAEGYPLPRATRLLLRIPLDELHEVFFHRAPGLGDSAVVIRTVSDYVAWARNAAILITATVQIAKLVWRHF